MSKTMQPRPRRPVDHSEIVEAAERLLKTLALARSILPPGFAAVGATDILLAMLLAEETSEYLLASKIAELVNGNPSVCQRWIRALDEYQLVERRGDLVALTNVGYDLTAQLLERVYRFEGG